MATAKEHIESIIAQMAQLRVAPDSFLADKGVREALKEIDDLADLLVEGLKDSVEYVEPQ